MTKKNPPLTGIFTAQAPPQFQQSDGLYRKECSRAILETLLGHRAEFPQCQPGVIRWHWDAEKPHVHVAIHGDVVDRNALLARWRQATGFHGFAECRKVKGWMPEDLWIPELDAASVFPTTTHPTKR